MVGFPFFINAIIIIILVIRITNNRIAGLNSGLCRLTGMEKKSNTVINPLGAKKSSGNIDVCENTFRFKYQIRYNIAIIKNVDIITK